MKRWLYALAASLALVGAGLVHGFWTDRWSEDVCLSTAAARLAEIPMQIGDWQGKEIEVKPGQAAPGVTGSVQRSYFNSRLGATVILALVNGRPGPVSTHTPEACYGASGYQVARRREVALDTKGDPAHFWTSDAIRSRVTDETKVRLFWAWNGGEGWCASNDARQQFSRFRYPVLHKLYVLRELTGAGATKASDKDEPCLAFLEALVPALERTVFQQDQP
jgi:hypothetical protein